MNWAMEVNEALDMAIEALDIAIESMQAIENGDYIELDEELEAMLMV